jgi:hypothetical protein
MRPYLEKHPSQNRASGVAEGVSLEFKPQNHKKKEGMGEQDLFWLMYPARGPGTQPRRDIGAYQLIPSRWLSTVLVRKSLHLFVYIGSLRGPDLPTIAHPPHPAMALCPSISIQVR